MKITITSPNIRLSDALRRDAEQRLNVILGRLANDIDHVSIVLTDDNGDRGGVDKQSRVQVMVHGLGTVTAAGRHENDLAAIDKALRRARRIILYQRKVRVARSRSQRPVSS